MYLFILFFVNKKNILYDITLPICWKRITKMTCIVCRISLGDFTGYWHNGVFNWNLKHSIFIDRIVKGFPPVSPYIGVSPTLCYLLKEKKSLCCLQLAQVCEHCNYRNARDYQWQNKTIILAADYASNGIYNFIIPLRAHFRSKTSLHPIILLLERRPDVAFLDSISYFPLVYWMLGSIDW